MQKKQKKSKKKQKKKQKKAKKHILYNIVYNLQTLYNYKCKKQSPNDGEHYFRNKKDFGTKTMFYFNLLVQITIC